MCGAHTESGAEMGDVVHSDATKRALTSRESALLYMRSLSSSALTRLQGWAAFRHPNYWYILFNGLQVAASLVVLILGFAVLNESRDDLAANVGFKLKDSTVSTVKPCGLPGPDMLHLLRLQGVHENVFGMPQLLEPDYDDWSVHVLGSLCRTDPYWTVNGADGVADGFTTSTTNRARKLHALASMMSRRDLASNSETTTELDAKETLMMNEFCRTDNHRVYSNRLDMAFGDPLTRISRAYLAAAPAFRRYRKSKDDASSPPTCLGEHDPFSYTDESGSMSSTCGNADYINAVLDGAGHRLESVKMAGTRGYSVDVLQKLVALYALALINHIDKTDNNAACFGNPNMDTALQLCQDLFGSDDFDTYGLSLPGDAPADPHNLDVRFYRYADLDAANNFKCSSTSRVLELEARDAVSVSPSPSPPPYDSWRGVHMNHGANSLKNTLISVCASTMQYGLYDQERLFGVPDVLVPFQSDNRPDASLHVIGRINPQSWLSATNNDEAFQNFQYPGLRLELFLAYRLAAIALWGSLIAVTTAFFIGRSATPLLLAASAIVLGLKDKEGKQLSIVQPNSRSLFQDRFTIFASVLAVLAGYYTLFVDPAALSYYPITPSCDEFVFDGKSHSSGGAYVTSWGKRRFSRFSEGQIGIFMFVLAAGPLLYSITKRCVQTKEKEKDGNDSTKPTKLDTGINVVLFVASLAIIVGQTLNCIHSGEAWHRIAELEQDTSEASDCLQRDCLAQVLIAFWVGLAFSVNRASWCFRQVKNDLMRLLFFTGSGFLIAMVLVSYLAILPNEYEKAFGGEDRDRAVAQVVILVGVSLFAGAVLFEWYGVEKETGVFAAQPGAKKLRNESVEGMKDVVLQTPVPLLARQNASGTLTMERSSNADNSSASDRVPLLGFSRASKIPMLAFR